MQGAQVWLWFLCQRRRPVVTVISEGDVPLTYLQFRFLSNLHGTGFSSCWITIMIHSYLVWFLWWLRHGAIGPSEATSFVGSMSTDLNSEFTHFNLVIRLSKVQQMALLLSTVFGDSRCSGCPCEPSAKHLYYVKLCRTSETSFSQQLLHIQTSCHDMVTGTHTAFRCGLFFFGCLVRWKHVVHLIRWNLSAVIG